MVLPVALADMEQAADWYGERAASLRLSFLADLERRIDQILEFPEAAPIYRGTMRRILFAKFPHGIFYVIRGDIIKILAVLHLKQRPDALKRRG